MDGYTGIMDGYGRIHRLRRLCGTREADVRIGDGASVAEGARQGGRLNQIESRGATVKSKHGLLEVLWGFKDNLNC